MTFVNNQGPVNAPLISGPSLSTKSKLAKFVNIDFKISQGRPRAISYTKFVYLESLMLHAAAVFPFYVL